MSSLISKALLVIPLKYLSLIMLHLFLVSDVAVGQAEKMEIDGAITIGNSENEVSPPGTIRFNPATEDFEGWTGQHWISFSTGIKQGSVQDIDSNTYKTVVIGTQEWMAENLNTTRYRNGDQIPNVVSESGWSGLTSGAYAYYDNLQLDYEDLYGKLYNGYAINDNRGLCPEGWKVPLISDWTALANYLGGFEAAYGKLKEAGFDHWDMPNTEATNETRFTGLPGGYRSSAGAFQGEGIWGIFALKNFSIFSLNYLNQDLLLFNIDKSGVSVRCIKE